MKILTPNALLQNRYRVLRPVGRGGMGTVYEAVDLRLNATVALKETLLTDPASRRAFEREAQLLARLRHPVLPKVIDHFSEDERQFLVMEFISGDDLAALMEKRGGQFPPAAIMPWLLRWADQLLDALDYLHKQNPPVIHRDIKPQNLKLTSRGDVILLDFGLARGGLADMTRSSRAGVVGFTPNYAPLEQIRGSDADPRSDLYSLAATLYHLSTGTLPPDALTRVAALLNEQIDPLQPANQFNEYVLPEVGQVLHQALATNIDERPESAAAMRKALHDARSGRMVQQPLIEGSNPAAMTAFTTGLHQSHDATPRIADSISLPSTAARTRQLSENELGNLVRTWSTGGQILSLAIRHDGSQIAIGNEDAQVQLWQFDSGNAITTLRGHSQSVLCVAFSNDGRYLASGSEDGKVLVWDTTEDLNNPYLIDVGHSVETLAISPNGRWLVVGGWGEVITLTRSSTILFRLSPRCRRALCIVWHSTRTARCWRQAVTILPFGCGIWKPASLSTR
ncbi:MAG: protein kinase [Chloroflexaceae bacterium]|nr:protein kinase [Chloroflexaceae bacterium]